MLVLERRKRERLFIGGCISVEVLEIRKHKIVLGIVAPPDVAIVRDDTRNVERCEHVLHENNNGTIGCDRCHRIGDWVDGMVRWRKQEPTDRQQPKDRAVEG